MEKSEYFCTFIEYALLSIPNCQAIRLFLLLLSASASLAQSLPYNTDNRLLADTSLSLPAWDTPPAYKGSETTLIQDFTDQFHIPPICYKLNLETRVVTAAVKQAAAHEKWK